MSEQRRSKRARNGRGELQNTPERSIPSTEVGGLTNPGLKTSQVTDADIGSDEVQETEVVASQSLQEIGILELLEQDSRPTFILDLHSPEPDVKGRMNVVFCNKSLRFSDNLRKALYGETVFPAPSPSSNASPDSRHDLSAAAAESDFKSWATTHIEDWNDGYLPPHAFRSLVWVCSTLRNRWRVVSASQVPSQQAQSHGTSRFNQSTSRSTNVSMSSVSNSPGADSLHSEEANLLKQLADSEAKLRILTELNSVGIFYLSPAGNVVYANDTCKCRS